MARQLIKGTTEAVKLSLRYIQEAYESVRKRVGLDLPQYQSPGHLSELLLTIEKNTPSIAFQLTFAVLLAPAHEFLCSSQSDPICRLYRPSERYVNGNFFPRWITFFTSPVGNNYINFLRKHQVELDINIETILTTQFSPIESTTYGEAYQMVSTTQLRTRYRNYSQIIDRWRGNIEMILRNEIKVPQIYIKELNVALRTEFANEVHERGNTKLGRHKSSYAIDLITAARILLHFAEKMRKFPYKIEYMEALIYLWIVFWINRHNVENNVGISEIQSNLPKDMIPEYQTLINLMTGSQQQGAVISNLTEDIVLYNCKQALHEWELSRLGKISGEAFMSFPHHLRFRRIPHIVLRRLRTDKMESATCEIAGRQLLSLLGMPCMTAIKAKSIQDILNQPPQ